MTMDQAQDILSMLGRIWGTLLAYGLIFGIVAGYLCAKAER